LNWSKIVTIHQLNLARDTRRSVRKLRTPPSGRNERKGKLLEAHKDYGRGRRPATHRGPSPAQGNQHTCSRAHTPHALGLSLSSPPADRDHGRPRAAPRPQLKADLTGHQLLCITLFLSLSLHAVRLAECFMMRNFNPSG
jgi:hypothetical protein